MPPPQVLEQTTRTSHVDFAVVGQLVSAQIAYLGVTQKQAAAAAGVDQSKVSFVRQGKTVGLENLCRLADWLQLPLDAFRVPPEDDKEGRARHDRRLARYCSAEDMDRRLGGLVTAAPIVRL